MPRYANAHAYINAGFCAKIQSNRIVEKPTIIFGGIRSSLVHAEKTEEFLTGKSLEDERVLKASLDVLGKELNPEVAWLKPDAQYLKTVAQGLLYKFFLNILGDKVLDPKIQSGAVNLQRDLSSGQQDYDTDEKEWPLYKPTIKVEARAQCAGEAQYTDDIPPYPNELYGAFVTSSVGNCLIDSIDASRALKADGVIAYLDARNIKGRNVFVTPDAFGNVETEEVFCSGPVKFAGQSLGLVVARTQRQAIEGVKLVQVKYRDLQKPILTIKEALEYPDRIIDQTNFGPPDAFDVGDLEEGWASSETIIEGEFETGGQYHFYMEPQVTICVPTEDGMDVFCATQEQDSVQSTVADVTNLERAQVHVQTRRLGGGFGGKASRSRLPAAACAIAAAELSRPVRIIVDLNTNMAQVGGRLPHYCKYKVGIDENGLLQAVEMTIISDCGSNFNEGSSFFAALVAKNCYSSKAWKFHPKLARTDTPSNTFCRGPGFAEGIAMIENLMEHLAQVRNEDPFEFRRKNMNPLSDKEVGPLEKIIDQLRGSSNYDQRLGQVKEFNMKNRWKKRGISLIPMIFPVSYPPMFRYNVLVAILHNGGSVAVTHGGIEMGQGINTKVSQVVARELGIDVSLVSIKPTNTLTNANGVVSSTSITSELNCYAAMKACRELKERMSPIKEKMPDADWKTLVEQCYNSNVDLTARHYYSAEDKLTGYTVHGATVSEVEVDVLTGEKLIRRVDIIEDAGQSISPLVDIGQVEGAFVMGIGLWTSEKITYDPTTGQKLSNGTWNYKPPINNDIPMDFRVTLLKNAAHPFGVMRSKTTGEPPLCMSASVLLALRHAVNSARLDSGNADWYQLDGPATIDKLHKLMLVNPEEFVPSVIN